MQEHPSESLFHAYLRQRVDLEFVRNLAWGERTPDFTITWRGGSVVAEVYNPELHLPNRAGAFNPIRPVGRALKGRKRDQGREVEAAGVPYVVVLGRYNSAIGFRERELGIALSKHVARYGPDSVRRFSALCTVSTFNPTMWRLEAATARFGDPAQASSDERRAMAVRAVEEALELQGRGVVDEDAALARLRVVHNPHATNPLPLDVLGGPHDEQWVLGGPRLDQLNRIWTGEWFHEVPGQ